MTGLDITQSIGVIGAGTMGIGIAQVAAAAGHRVRIFDAVPEAAQTGRDRIGKGLDALVARGRMSCEEVDALLERVDVAQDLAGLADCGLVIEAIVEDLEVKRRLFAQLEQLVGPDAILASNTSSISLTSIAAGCVRPHRVAGMHFFNPAPVMKLVEIVSGLATAPETASCLFATAEAWGKVAVHARSTPGFIVNRVARPYYAEALRLYEEQVADPVTIDALLTQGGGFRMGPFELMDLIGNDVNYAVSLSVFNAYYQEPRFRPSITQLELVNAGFLGRKTKRGFYDYGESREKATPSSVTARGEGEPIGEFQLGTDTIVDGVQIALTDGRTAQDLARSRNCPVILYDLSFAECSRLAFSCSAGVPDAVIDRFIATLGAVAATRVPDWPGLVVMRTVAMLANEAFEAVLQGVASEQGVDAAMRFGVNYPRGPLEWARSIGLPRVLAVVDHIHDQTRDPRYRASLGLRMAVNGA